MKKIVKITILTVTLIAVLLCAVACGSNKEIASINGHSTIYRYKVKEVQLVEKGTKKVLTTNTDFKYYYGALDTYYYAHDYIYGNSELQYYFPDLHVVYSSSNYNVSESGAYCKEYKTDVYVRAIFEKYDKVYRPAYKVDGVVATVNFTDIKSLTDGRALFKKEIGYSKFKKVYKEEAQKVFELSELNDDYKALEEYWKELKEKSLGYACVYEENEIVNLCRDELDIEYYRFYID